MSSVLSLLGSSMLSGGLAAATQNGDEGGTKLAVKDGVDDRIQRRVAVAEPEDDGEELFRCISYTDQ